MNAFIEHHRPSIRFGYSCFDRILLNAVIQPLQRPPVIVGFLDKYRKVPSITRQYFREVSAEYNGFVERLASRYEIPLVYPPKGVRREEWVDRYFHRLGNGPGIAVILKSRENGRIAVSYPSKTGGNRIELCQRWVWQYYFYLRDRDFGQMFVRVCSYFPFNARVCINGHEWLAERMRRQGLAFRQQANAFLTCSAPERLQQLSDAFSGKHIEACGQYWLGKLVPFFTDFERRHGSCQHRLFVSQVEYCTNLVFERRAALERMSERLLDLNRTIGRPDRLSTIFGRRITKNYGGNLKTQIADYHLGNPVIRSDYKRGSVKQYVRDHLMLRVETTSYNTRDLGVNRAVENLPQLRLAMNAVNDRYLEIQQDILETYVDRGQLQKLAQPTRSARSTAFISMSTGASITSSNTSVSERPPSGSPCLQADPFHPKTRTESPLRGR